MDFKSPQPILDELQKVVEHGIFGYTDLNEAFYESIQHWLKKTLFSNSSLLLLNIWQQKVTMWKWVPARYVAPFRHKSKTNFQNLSFQVIYLVGKH